MANLFHNDYSNDYLVLLFLCSMKHFSIRESCYDLFILTVNVA